MIFDIGPSRVLARGYKALELMKSAGFRDSGCERMGQLGT